MNAKKLYIANLCNLLLPTSCLRSFKISLYRWAGVKIGKNCDLFQGAKITGIGNIEIGENVFIGIDATIITNKGSNVIIEDYALVGHHSIIATGFHPITPEGPRIIGYEGTCSTVRIEKGASLGMRAILLPGKKLGAMSHAAAGSVITHDVEPYTRVGGIPARFIKNLKE